MKNEKSTGTAMLLNFLVWGLGYFYLNKQVIKGFIVFILYFLIWLFSILLMLIAGYPLIFPIMFWVVFWSLWCGIFLAYDAYKISKEVKPAPLKIQKVKTVVRRLKVQTKRK
jgi:hypothetical protein